MEINFVPYLGKEDGENFSGFIKESNFFACLQIKANFSKKKAEELLQNIFHKLDREETSSLAQFETIILSQINEASLPLDFSFSSGYLKGKICYLKTIGKGVVVIKRGGKVAKIVSGDNTASGYIKEKDLLIFSSEDFIELIDASSSFEKIIKKKEINGIMEDLSLFFKDKNNDGMVALFIEFNKNELIDHQRYNKEINSSPNKIKTFFNNFYRSYKDLNYKAGKKKKYTFLMIIVIVIVFIWSVAFGYKRRSNQQLQQKFKLSKELIIQKLNQADETAYLNLSRSQILIGEARKELDNLKEERKGKNLKEVGDLENLINQKEAQITKKEEKSYEEFFDLTVESKTSKATKIFSDEGSAYLLDNINGAIYTLSLEKKTLNKISFNEIKSAKLISAYNSKVYFYVEGKGIYEVNNNKLKKIINQDDNWKEIIDLWNYNGNIYLLDKGGNQIYKYLITDDGYSAKRSYLKNNQIANFDKANSMAIDSSIYVGFNNYIIKYVSGRRDSFKTLYPTKSIEFEKIFTNKKLDSIFVWDKVHKAVYVLSKNGSYEKEINSTIMAKSSDFIVFKNALYFLSKAKIYKISL